MFFVVLRGRGTTTRTPTEDHKYARTDERQPQKTRETTDEPQRRAPEHTAQKARRTHADRQAGAKEPQGTERREGRLRTRKPSGRSKYRPTDTRRHNKKDQERTQTRETGHT